MTIVCHTRKFIFLKSKKTAGSSIELWLTPHLDPRVDIVAPVQELRQDPEMWAKYNAPSSRVRLAVMRAAWKPIFRQHMPAADVRRFVGDRTWREYRKITIMRDPWDRTISAWRWSEREGRRSRSLADFVARLETEAERAKAALSPIKRQRLIAKYSNWPFCAIDGEIVADEIIRYETLESQTRALFGGLGISGGELPRAKSGIRKSTDGLQLLTPDLIERIGVLHKHEVDAFGYRPPAHAGTDAAAGRP